ncbi:MAG: signal recognition particle-docking protein FtsY, partial [Actinomycetota bacterium]
MNPALIVTISVVIAVIILIGFIVLLLASRRGGPTEALPAAPEETPPDLEPTEALPAAPEPEPALAPPVTPKGPSRLAEGLRKTRGALAERLSVLTRRERLDDEAWDDVEEALIRADVGIKATAKVVDACRLQHATPSTLYPQLREQMVAILSKGDHELKLREPGPSVWLVIGVNGVGKTTTIAKLAQEMRREGKTVVLAAADTFRAAAIDQLGTWAERIGIHMVSHGPGADPGAVVFDAIAHAKGRSIDLVIVDTAGRLHTKSNLMEELKKIGRIAEREAGGVDEVLLVIDATVGQNGISQARTFGEAMGVTGVVLTKLDGTARGGIVIAIQQELGIPVKAVGVGETLDDIEPFVVE